MSYSNIVTNANIIDASTMEDTFQESSFLEKNSTRNDLEQTGVQLSPVCMSVIPELRNVPEHSLETSGTKQNQNALHEKDPDLIGIPRTDEHVKKINSNIQFCQDQTILADTDAATRLPVSAGTWRS